jgi:hypothetical protein
MSEIMRKLGSDADRTAVVFITVDPERDTPEDAFSPLNAVNPTGNLFIMFALMFDAPCPSKTSSF